MKSLRPIPTLLVFTAIGWIGAVAWTARMEASSSSASAAEIRRRGRLSTRRLLNDERESTWKRRDVATQDQLRSISHRLETGEPVTTGERALFFNDAIRTDSLEALELWCRVSGLEDHTREASWFNLMFRQESTRAAAMRVLERNSCGFLAAQMIGHWITDDPNEVQHWILEDSQRNYRSELFARLIDARIAKDPAEAWAWSQTLPDPLRAEARVRTLISLANNAPDDGSTIINQLTDLDDRQDSLLVFGKALAESNSDRWSQWRDSLPPAEQDRLNQANFLTWLRADSTKACAWLAGRPDGPERSRLVYELARQFAGSDPVAVSEWIQSIGDPAQRLRAISESVREIDTADSGKIATSLSSEHTISP